MSMLGFVLALVGMILLMVTGIGIQQFKRSQNRVKLRQAVTAMDHLNGYQFEDYTARLLRRNHFHNVRQTAKEHDCGLDVIAERNHVRYGFQCKHYRKRRVNRKALRITANGARYYHVQEAIVLTNRNFTSEAVRARDYFHVRLWNRQVLIKLIWQSINA